MDDPGQPYSCEQWGNIGEEGIPLVVDDGNGYNFHSWFSIDGNFLSKVVIDHNMVFRHFNNSPSNWSVYDTVYEILSESSWITGDFNNDEIVDVLDIVLLIDNIISDGYFSYEFDLNQDLVINILDIIAVVNIILDS